MADSKMDWTDELVRLGACREAVEWCRGYKSLAAAWKACERCDWMLWLISKLEPSDPWSEERKLLVWIALDCAHLAPWREDEYTLARIWCLDALERWLSGDAERDEVIAAALAAYAAYAALAAYAAYAVNAAALAAYAAYAVNAAALAAYAAYAAADIVRSHHPRAPKMRGER